MGERNRGRDIEGEIEIDSTERERYIKWREGVRDIIDRGKEMDR